MDHQALTLLRNSGGAVLLVCRPDNGGQWSLPGGAVRADEPPHAAQRRTLTEQTGLTTAARDVLVADYGPAVPGVLPDVLTLVWNAGTLPDETAAALPTTAAGSAWLDLRFVDPGQLAEYANRHEARRILAALAAADDSTAPRYRYRGGDPDPDEAEEL